MNKVNPRKRILFLFAHLHKGGMQRAVSNISMALPSEFIQYVAFFGTESPGFKYNATLVDFNIPGSKTAGIVSKIFNFIKRLIVISRYVRHNNIDTVVSFGESANVYNLMSASGAKKIIASRVTLNESLAGGGIYTVLYKFLIRILYPLADRVIAVSEALGQQMREIVGDKDKVTVIPNLYHTEEIVKLSQENLPENLAYLEKRKFILNVGSFCYQKGQDDLIKIFKSVHEKCDDVLLVIMGRGEWKDKLLNLTENLGLKDVVIFVDFDENPYRYMARASTFILASRFEGFPNVLVEAMICGVPVVAFDCPTGPYEILGNNEWGFLIKGRSEEMAIMHLTELLTDDVLSERMRFFAVRRGKDYSSGRIISMWNKELS